METLRFLRFDHTYADFSTSVSPAIERALEERRSVSTVVLDVFGEDSITVGYLDDPEKCLDLEYCGRAGIVVRRRRNTGGAILGARGSAFLVLFLDTRLPWVPMKSMADGFRVSLTAMAESLRELFGIGAVYRPVNDVEVAGRKIVASSARLESEVLTMRLLLNVSAVNPAILRGAIRTPPEKVADKRIRDAAQRVTCIEEGIGREVSRQEIEALVKRCVEAIFGTEVSQVPDELNPVERAYAEEFTHRFTSDGWLYANSERTRFGQVPRDAARMEGLHKAPAGLIRATLLASQGKIRDVIITGDFHAKPIGVVEEMENRLRGARLSAEEIAERIRVIMSRPDVEIPGVEVKDFLAAFTKALHPIPSVDELSSVPLSHQRDGKVPP